MRRVCGFAGFRRCTEVVVRKASESGRSKAGDSGLQWRDTKKRCGSRR